MGCRTILGMATGDARLNVKTPFLAGAASGQWSAAGGNDDQQGLGGQRSLAAAVHPKSTPFHGADGADALQRSDQQWPCVRGKNDRWRLGAATVHFNSTPL